MEHDPKWARGAAATCLSLLLSALLQPCVAAEGATAATGAPTASPPGLGRSLDAERLAGQRGGASQASEMQLRGVVAGNRAVAAPTGHNSIAGGAFQGTSGLPMVIQNSGNNVLIQNATIINVRLH